jgi:hypothetical protein
MWGRTSVVLAAMAASVLVLPACLGGSDDEASVPSTSGGASPTPPSSTAVAAKLSRPLHFPRVADGRCPASRGRYVATPTVRGIALGSGPVRVFVNNAGDLRHGRAHLASTDFPEWLALKTHFFSSPGYQGPFLVRTKRLDRAGPIALGGRPTKAAPLLVPSGPAANGVAGWREFPYSTFVKSPGCYAWQVDGLTFSEIIVVRMLAKFNA